MKVPITLAALMVCIAMAASSFMTDGFRDKFALIELRLDAAELALAAKIPEPIKFYTIPGYSCDTTEWKGHCSNLNMSQAEYDKKNSHLFKVTSN